MASGTLVKHSGSQSRRRRSRDFAVSGWLGAGALSVGVGAAVLGGAAVAQADNGDGGSARPDRASVRTANASSSSSSSSSSSAAGPRAAASRKSAAPAATADPTDSALKSALSAARTAQAALPTPAATVTTPSAAGSTTSAVAPRGKALGQPGPIVTFFISDGTQDHPNAGLLIGNGFSYTFDSCSTGGVAGTCNGGRGGLLLGNGGSGYGGGNGGRAVTFGNGGTGATGIQSHPNGGNGGAAGLFGNGGDGGWGYFRAESSGGNGGRGGLIIGNGGRGGVAGQKDNGGDGGRGGLLFGIGGRGGAAGSGTVACAVDTCTVTNRGGQPGQGGGRGLFGRRGEQGFGILPADAPQFDGYTAIFPVLAPPGAANPGLPEIDAFGLTANGNYPNPYFVAGTKQSVELPAGFALARWGGSTGSFLGPDGAPFASVVLAPASQVTAYSQYVVKDPAKLPPAVYIEQSQVAGWYGLPDGGLQWHFLFAGSNADVPIEYLVDAGYLTYK